jgi:hypothetical protein
MRAFGRVLAALSITVIGVLGFARGTAAYCETPPPFAETIASAQQIVIGDVAAVRPGNDDGTGRSTSFTLHVTHVVRGSALANLDIDNVPTWGCPGAIVAAVGDRIALALNATAFDPPTAGNGVAWIGGQPPDGFESTNIEAVYKLAGVPMPDAGAAAPKPDPPSPWLGPAMWGLGVGLVFVIGAVVARRVVTAR